MRALTPVDLEQATLAAALRRLCDTASARSDIVVTFHEVGPPTALPTPVDVALLRIAQGALANTVQHAGASRADVTLTTADTVVSLDVVDDGAGFVPGQVNASDAAAGAGGDDGDGVNDSGRTGFGLRSMHERAALLGGRLTVESRPGAGTAISVHLDRTGETPAESPTMSPIAILIETPIETSTGERVP